MPARRLYRDSKGRFVSQQTWKWIQQENQAQARVRVAKQVKAAKHVPTKAKADAFWSAPKLFRQGNLGQNVPSRFGTKTGARRQEARAARIDKGAIPKADKSIRRTLKAAQFYPDAKAPGKDVKYATHYWRFEGLDSEDTIRGLLTLLQAQSDTTGPQWLAAVNIGSGFGKGGDWIGSHWDTPRAVRLYLDIWKNRPSAKNLLENAENGGPIWYEVVAEAKVVPRQARRKYGNLKGASKSSRKRSNKARVSKAVKSARLLPRPNRLQRAKH